MEPDNPTYRPDSGIRNWFRRRSKWWLVVIFLLVLIGILRLGLRSQLLFQYLKGKVETVATESINGKVTIGTLDGDLWNHLNLDDLNIISGDTLLHVDTLHVSYSILHLIRSPHTIASVSISGLHARLKQLPDSTWNIMSLLKTSGDTSSSTFAFPFDIRNLQIRQTSIYADSPFMIPDSVLQIHDLSLQSSILLEPQKYRFDLKSLQFKASNRQLEGPLSFETKASAKNNEYTLDKLILATGHTIISMNGHFSGDTTKAHYSMDFTGNPIGWKEVQAFVKEYPFVNDIHTRLSIQGDYHHTQLTLNATAPNLGDFEVKSTLQFKPIPALTSLTLNIRNANLSQLTKNKSWPDIDTLTANFKGLVPIENYENGHLKGKLTIKKISSGPYKIDHASLAMNLSPDSTHLELNANRGKEQARFVMNIGKSWYKEPHWKLALHMDHINPAVWLSDTTQDGSFSVAGHINGNGWQPGKAPWKLALNLLKSRYKNQPISGGVLTASLTDNLVHGNVRLQLSKSEVNASANCQWSDKVPIYNFTLATKGFNMSDIEDLKNYPTSINFRIKGSGESFNLKNMKLRAIATADSSVINKEKLDSLYADISIDKSILDVRKVLINSSIATGRFSARENLMHYDDPSNKLRYDIHLINIQSLAPLLGVQKLQTKGDLLGEMKLKDNKLQFVGEAYLNDIQYDTVSINKVNGQGEYVFSSKPSFKAYLELQQPSVGTVKLNDFKINTSGQSDHGVITGEYTTDLNILGKAGSMQKGRYYLSKDSSSVDIRNFVCSTSIRNLTLAHPVRVIYAHQTLRTDTLDLRAKDGAYLKMQIGELNSEVKKAYLDANKLNFGGILEIFVQHPEYTGLVSGHADVDIHRNNIELHSHITLSKMTYHKLRLDSIRFAMQIQKNRLLANGFIENNGKRIVIGEADLPFRLGNPTTFDTTFFDHSISGFLKMEPIHLSNYQNFLKEIGYSGLNGTLQFNGSLAGDAGNPDMKGTLLLSGSKLSNVPIDSVSLGFQYQQKKKQIRFDSRVISMHEMAAQITGHVPFSLDLKRFNIVFPTATDSIRADIQTNNFNLTALNEFISPEMARELKGTMNANVHVKGTLGNPYLVGSMKLTNGGMKVVPANVELKNMTLDAAFEPHIIQFKKVDVTSNGGHLNVTGDIDLKKLETTSFNLAFIANKFRVLNSRNYKAVVSMNANLTGSVAHPVLKGALTVNSGVLYLDNFGTKSVEAVQLSKQPQSPLTGTAIYDSLQVDAKLNINRNFWLRNRASPELGLELNGSVEAVKKPNKELQLFGDFQSSQGYATQFGKRFEMVNGTITFSGDPTNPQLNIKTLYKLRQPNDISIYYLITGTVQKPKFNYESTPSMDLKNIISYTLFGRPFNALLSWEQSVSGNTGGASEAAKSALMNLLINRMESLATNKLGIDVIQIDNSGRGVGNGTTIKIGKYITDRIFLAVLQQLGGTNPASEVILEYYLHRNFGVTLTEGQGQDSKTGIDIFWNYNY